MVIAMQIRYRYLYRFFIFKPTLILLYCSGYYLKPTDTSRHKQIPIPIIGIGIGYTDITNNRLNSNSHDDRNG